MSGTEETKARVENAGFCQSYKTGGLLPPLYADLSKNTAAEIKQWIADFEFRINDTLLLPPAKPTLKFIWHTSEHRANGLRNWREIVQQLQHELLRREPALFEN